LPAGLITNTVELPWVMPDSGHGTVILAEMGSNVLEFATVARISGNDSYRQAAEKGLRAVHAANKHVRGWCAGVGGVCAWGLAGARSWEHRINSCSYICG